ncbi:MAG TPA: ester cyclase [Gemmatimonadaceae bacterium]|nr:ester cyclase [Gemmatimonadaceae bacterium]
MNRTATLAIALMITPVALLRPDSDGARASDARAAAETPAALDVMHAWLAALNEGALSNLGAVVADSVRVDGRVVSRDEFLHRVTRWRAAAGLRAARATPLVTDGAVVGIWTWSEPRGAEPPAAGPSPEPVHWLGADFLRLQNGRIVEGWFHANRLGFGSAGSN